MLIGTKSDLKSDIDVLHNLENTGESIVSSESAMKLVNELDLTGFAECSSLTKEGLNPVFEASIKFGNFLKQELAKQKESTCHIF